MKTLWYLMDDGKKPVSRVQVGPQARNRQSCSHKIYTWRSHVTILDVLNKCSVFLIDYKPTFLRASPHKTVVFFIIFIFI